MIKGVTSSGFKFSIDEKALADWRLIKKLAKLKGMEEMTEDDGTALEFIGIMSDIEEIIFKDKGEAFERHILKQNDGYVAPVEAIKELLEILKSNKETKN